MGVPTSPPRPAKPAREIKDTQQLRDFLVEQMEGVANGTVTAERAKGVANLSQQIYNTLNIEIKQALISEKLKGVVVKPIAFK